MDNNYIKHIIKCDHRDGVKLPPHQIETWCGHQPGFGDWLFQDAQHALISIERDTLQVPCKKCLAAIIKTAQGGCDVPPWPITAVLATLWIIAAIADGFFR